MRKEVVAVLLLILILSGAAGYYFYPRQATYSLHGTEIITTTASSNQMGNLLHRTAWELGNVVAEEDGRKRFPSFHQGGRSWKDEAGNIIAGRGITEFDDKSGNHCVIEDIAIPGKPTLILLKSDTNVSTMELANEVMRQFRLLKVKHKK
jgi:hypothetical protein